MFADVDRHRFLCGRGMVSDDTDHTCFVALSLLESGADPNSFERHLARHLRWWLLGVPAGVGLATLRATMRLCVGIPPSRSGVWSAGNGPSMRSAILGAYTGQDPTLLADLVRRSTRITHIDPKAEIGALAIATAAHVARVAPAVSYEAFTEAFETTLAASSIDRDSSAVDEFRRLLKAASASAEAGQSTLDFTMSIGSRAGVSGYVYHTVPAVLQTWLRYPDDFRAGVVEIIRAGGDTDTTASILAALIGTRVGPDGIPKEWLDNLWEWPRTVGWMRNVSTRLAENVGGSPASTPPYPTWQIPARNLIFTSTVLAHGLRRLLPPY